MELRIIHDPITVYAFLKDKPRYDYIYQFSNLPSEQWKNVICFGLFNRAELKEIAMLNINYDIPVLLAASFNGVDYSIELVKQLKSFLPTRFYTHINKSTLDAVFSQDKIFELEEYMNMGLSNYAANDKAGNSKAIRLGYEDIEAIKRLISESYPAAWLDDALVKLNENFGIYADGRLVSFAGIHAYSEEYQVAAVAHVTTHPDYRNRGFAGKVVASLTKSLMEKIKFIGLNVKVDNINAINCYKKLGFKEFGRFSACEIELK